MNDHRISVMQVIDSLGLGGAERMAVNVANLLPRDRFRVHLCSTRKEGPLAKQVLPDVSRLVLNRTTRLSEPRALYDFVRYVRKNEIRILHCHQNTVFFCSLASLFCPSVALVWHDHFAGPVVRPPWLYRMGTLRVYAIISVNESLARWAQEELGFAADKVFFVNNFVAPSWSDRDPNLPARTGQRIVCTANINLRKDIINLLHAMALVVQREPEAQLLIIGAVQDQEYYESVKKAIADHDLRERVFLLGSREDVYEILARCDVGVLSSAFEGLPLALIEYGMAGLAAVATRVGQCAEVLGGGRNGILVPPGDPQSLADAIVRLLRSDSEREALGREFKRAANEIYGPDRNIDQIIDIYDSLLQKKKSLSADVMR